MAKTNPIGVRFREDVLEHLKTNFSVEGHQKALNFLERFYVTHWKLGKDISSPLRKTDSKPPKKENMGTSEDEQSNGTKISTPMPKGLSKVEQLRWLRENPNR